MGDGVVGVVKVKPLVWIGEDGDEYAEALGFRYLLCDPSSSDECRGWYVLEDNTNTVIGKNDGSPSAAKAAAQADYEARIMAALDVQPMDVKISLDTAPVRAMLDDAEKSVSHFSTIAATITVNALRHGATHAQIMDFITGKSDFVNWLHDQVKTQPVTVQRAARVPEVQALIDALRSTLNFVENTENEMGIILGSGDRARAALRAIADTD